MESPLPLPALPLARDGGGVQGAGAEGVGRDLDVRQRQHAAVQPKNGGMFKNDLEVVGIATDDKGKAFSTDRNTVNLNMKPDTAKRVRGHRLPRHPVARPAAGPLPAARGRARSQHPQGRLGDVRPRGAGLLQGAAVDERHRADVGDERRRADGAPQGSAREAAAGPADAAIASSRRPTRSRCSPRSTTTSSSRTRSRSPRR